MSVIDDILDPIPIPRMVEVRQRFDRPVLHDIPGACLEEMRKQKQSSNLTSGMRVAVTVGSRGISNLPVIVGTVIAELKAWGMEPFVVPAMGSHGGATPEGQADVLKEMGVTEDYIKAPIISSLETVQIGTTQTGIPVRIDAHAWNADAVIVLNRVKPHVAFRGEIESGLLKMIAIGLGKQYGAQICHTLGFGAMVENIQAIAEVVLSHDKIAFGLAVLENPYHETARIESVAPQDFLHREKELLQEARSMLPRFHLKKFDALIIDEIGKNIAGSGFDTNVVGRFHTPFIQHADTDPVITRIAALDLTHESHGNANGVGILDFISQRLKDKIDTEQMYPNSLTSTVPVPVKIPMVLKNDKQVFQAAIRTSNILNPQQVRLCRITNTQKMDAFLISENLIDEALKHPDIEVVGQPFDLPFDGFGNLLQ